MVCIITVASLVACGSVDPVSQKVMDDINALGTIDLSDEESIEKISSTYATLTDSQKNQVKNYTTLLEAQDKIDELKNEQAKIEEEKKAKLAEERESVLKIERDYYSDVNRAVNSLKNGLKVPNSLVIDEVLVKKTANLVFVYILYSAKNKAGGEIEDTYFYSVSLGMGQNDSGSFDTWKKYATGKVDSLGNKIGEDFYCSQPRFSKDSEFAFLVDMDDFEAQGY